MRPLKRKKIKKESAERERQRTSLFIRNLVSHGLTGPEMKMILREIRVRWWEREDVTPGKELRK